MRYNSIIKCDVANGPGFRVSLFLQGCHLHCKHCFNKDLWDFNGGTQFSPFTLEDIRSMCEDPHISGLSILGGEPLSEENLGTLGMLLWNLRCVYNRGIAFLNKSFWEKLKPDVEFPVVNKTYSKSIWLWTGYTWEELTDKQKSILKYIDVLVDGPFIEELKDLSLKWRGSSNQRLIDVQESLKQNKVVLYED